MLMNVGAGGGAAAAPAAAGGAAAASGDAPAEEAKEEKAEGRFLQHIYPGLVSGNRGQRLMFVACREGGVRRGHGFRSLRLSARYLYEVDEKRQGLDTEWNCTQHARVGVIRVNGTRLKDVTVTHRFHPQYMNAVSFRVQTQFFMLRMLPLMVV